ALVGATESEATTSVSTSVSNGAQAALFSKATNLSQAFTRRNSAVDPDLLGRVQTMLDPAQVNPASAGLIHGYLSRTLNCLFVTQTTANFLNTGAPATALPRLLELLPGQSSPTLAPLDASYVYPTGRDLDASWAYWRARRNEAILAGTGGIHRESIEADILALGRSLGIHLSPNQTTLIDGEGTRALDNLVGHVKSWPANTHGVIAINPASGNRHYFNIANVEGKFVAMDNQTAVQSSWIHHWLSSDRLAPHEVTPLGRIHSNLVPALTEALRDATVRERVLVL
ncbi:MAG: hypothetical protein KC416_13155, partial [Myxococcales bacterium]|nr:hypothetical protein [Myxococcales bacterium]